MAFMKACAHTLTLSFAKIAYLNKKSWKLIVKARNRMKEKRDENKQ